MAWSSPPRAVPDSLFSAEYLNTYLRDNLLETMPALAEDEGSFFGSNGINQIQIAGYATARVIATGTTTSSTYTTISGGPSLTMTSNNHSFVVLSAEVVGSTSTTECYFSYEIDGATFNPPNDQNAFIAQGTAQRQYSIIIPHTTLVLPGTNTFTAQYRVEGGGTASFGNRTITVFTI